MTSTAHDPLDASNAESTCGAEAQGAPKGRVRGGRLFLQVPDYVKPALRGLIASFAAFASSASLGRDARPAAGRPMKSDRLLADHLLRQVAKLTAQQVAKMPVSNFSRGAMGAVNERIALSCDKRLLADASANAQRLGATLQDCVRAMALGLARKSASPADAQAIDRFIRAHTRPAAIALSENGTVKGIAPIAHEVVFCKSIFRQRFRERCAALGVYEKAAYAEALAGFASHIREGASLDAGEQPPFASAAETNVAASVSRSIEGQHERAPSGAKAWNLYADRAVFDELFELARIANVSRARVMRAALLRWLETDTERGAPRATTATARAAGTAPAMQNTAFSATPLSSAPRATAGASTVAKTDTRASAEGGLKGEPMAGAPQASRAIVRNHPAPATRLQPHPHPPIAIRATDRPGAPSSLPAGAWKPQSSQRSAVRNAIADTSADRRAARALPTDNADATPRTWLSPEEILGTAVASIPSPEFRESPDWDDSDDADPVGEAWKASTGAAAGWGAV